MKQQNLPKKNIYQIWLRILRNMLIKSKTLIVGKRLTQLCLKSVNPNCQRKEEFKQEVLRMNLRNACIVRGNLQIYPNTLKMAIVKIHLKI